VALNTLLIPHPYPEGAAAEWIAGQQQTFDAGVTIVFAVTERAGGAVAGAIGLRLARESDSAEVGYWIGVPFWGRGYATEGGGAVVAYAFDGLGLNRVYAEHFARNEASGRVLQKLGMRHEGTHRQSHKKWGEYLDSKSYAILREEWS
jgi:RimJ/RimL family protein N-acetyltransferase